MTYDVAASIKDLLFEHDSIIIPGFGGFVLDGQNASIDYIKSTISPPTKVASFNKNLTLNDGVLVNHIKKQNDCNQDEANQILQNFIEEINEKISKKEIVEFPQVGRLYKDYNKSLQFLPYDTNFNTEVFGLPKIEAHPFSRTEEVKTKAAAASAVVVAENAATSFSETASATVENPITAPEKIIDPIQEAAAAQAQAQKKKKGFFGWTQATIPLLALASILIVVMSYFFLFKKDKTDDNGDASSTMTTVDNIKINEKPSTDEAEVIPLPSADGEENNGDGFVNDDEENSDNNASLSSEIETVGTRECIVIVGQFSVKSNAEKFADKVESDGYESHIGWNNAKEWNTVGVKFNYVDDIEKEDMLKILQEKYDESAWILRD